TCRKEYQRSEIVSCSGGDTKTKITQAILRCSAKERLCSTLPVTVLACGRGGDRINVATSGLLQRMSPVLADFVAGVPRGGREAVRALKGGLYDFVKRSRLRMLARLRQTAFAAAMSVPELFYLDAGKLDHLGPFRGFCCDVPAELAGRHRHRYAAEI